MFWNWIRNWSGEGAEKVWHNSLQINNAGAGEARRQVGVNFLCKSVLISIALSCRLNGGLFIHQAYWIIQILLTTCLYRALLHWKASGRLRQPANLKLFFNARLHRKVFVHPPRRVRLNKFHLIIFLLPIGTSRRNFINQCCDWIIGLCFFPQVKNNIELN